jgi:hypothetical protein
MAISAATSILTFVLEEEDIRRALVGTPLYVHMMIAFASVFLMKVATRWNRIMGFNIQHSYLNVSHLLEKIIDLLKGSITSERHIIRHIAAGLEKMLSRMAEEAYAENHQAPPSDLETDEGQKLHRASAYGGLLLGAPGFSNGPQTALGASAWDTLEHPQADDVLGDASAFMNDSLLYEAFGTESANDVYSLLTSHFTQ